MAWLEHFKQAPLWPASEWISLALIVLVSVIAARLVTDVLDDIVTAIRKRK